jgi:hypothetical protein
MKRNHWAAVVFAVLLFGAGVVCGILGQRYFTATVVSAKTSEDYRQSYLSEMKSKLKLSPDQINRLEVILDETKAKYKAVRDESRPAMLRVRQEQIDQVRSILAGSQVAAYDKLIAERERRYKDQEDRDRQADLKREADHRAKSHQ